MPEHMHVVDDGTLDTLLYCDLCGECARYTEADREELGEISEDWLAQAADEHLMDCLLGPEV